MPPSKPLRPAKSMHEVASDVGLYPPEAYEFVQHGLAHAVRKIHGATRDQEKSCRHVSGAELCEAIRELAVSRWGLLARTVLARWNIRRTLDFGNIVFAMVSAGFMQTTQQDSIEDFRDVYDFKRAFESEYRFEKLI